jgi:hypothetical protein
MQYYIMEAVAIAILTRLNDYQETSLIIAYARASCAVYRQLQYRSQKKDCRQLSPVY